MRTEREVRRLLAAQLGLITLEQVLDAGGSRSLAAYRVGTGEWERVLPGVYRDRLVTPSLRQACFAANLWGGADAVIARTAAGALWGLDGVAAAKPELWVPKTSSARAELVVVHRGDVALDDRRRIGPITLTSPARTIVDLAAVLEDEDLTAVVEDAIHRGLTTQMSILRCLDRLGGQGRRGTTRLRKVLEDRGAQRPAMSRLEVKIWRTLRAKGLTPIRQHPLQIGGTTYYLDFAFPQWRVSVEGFGDKFHRSPRKRKHELQRLADLASVHWRVLPVTWDDITDRPDEVVRKIITALAA